jgi:hypothetical protein
VTDSNIDNEMFFYGDEELLYDLEDVAERLWDDHIIEDTLDDKCIFPRNKEEYEIFIKKWFNENKYPVYKAVKCNARRCSPRIDVDTVIEDTFDYAPDDVEFSNLYDKEDYNKIKKLEKQINKLLMRCNIYMGGDVVPPKEMAENFLHKISFEGFCNRSIG